MAVIGQVDNMRKYYYIVCGIIRKAPERIRGPIKQYIERTCNTIYTVATMYYWYNIYRNNPP